MVSRASREATLKELLQRFQRRYRPIYISLVSKEEFLDILNLENYPTNSLKEFLAFSEDDWLRLKDVMVKAFEAMDYEIFIKRYFSEPNEIEFEYKCNDHVCTLIWWMPSQKTKETFFHLPGAAMIREMDDYWVFMLFSNETGNKKTYENEMNTLGHIIEQLEERIN